MIRDGRRDRALLLASVAILGLAVTPLLHAEQHLREQDEEDDEGPGAGHHPHHSHGPGHSGEHGAGSLEHLALALHSAPRLPAVLPAPVEHAPPASLEGQLRAVFSYLVPDASQGPPDRC